MASRFANVGETIVEQANRLESLDLVAEMQNSRRRIIDDGGMDSAPTLCNAPCTTAESISRWNIQTADGEWNERVTLTVIPGRGRLVAPRLITVGFKRLDRRSTLVR
jgi:hypothetical protein